MTTTTNETPFEPPQTDKDNDPIVPARARAFFVYDTQITRRQVWPDVKFPKQPKDWTHTTDFPHPFTRRGQLYFFLFGVMRYWRKNPYLNGYIVNKNLRNMHTFGAASKDHNLVTQDQLVHVLTFWNNSGVRWIALARSRVPHKTEKGKVQTALFRILAEHLPGKAAIKAALEAPDTNILFPNVVPPGQGPSDEPDGALPNPRGEIKVEPVDAVVVPPRANPRRKNTKPQRHTSSADTISAIPTRPRTSTGGQQGHLLSAVVQSDLWNIGLAKLPNCIPSAFCKAVLDHFVPEGTKAANWQNWGRTQFNNGPATVFERPHLFFNDQKRRLSTPIHSYSLVYDTVISRYY